MNNVEATEQAFRLVGVNIKQLRDYIGTISALSTTNKTNLVLAINELDLKMSQTITSYTSFLNYISDVVQLTEGNNQDVLELKELIETIKNDCLNYKNSALQSSDTAIAQALISTAQAVIATSNAGIAITKAAEASSSKDTAVIQAGIATTKAVEVAATKALIDIIYSNMLNPSVIIPITNKGEGDTIIHNLDSNFIIQSFQDFDDGNRVKTIFYNTDVTSSQFILKNDFTNDKFNGRLLCVKY